MGVNDPEQPERYPSPGSDAENRDTMDSFQAVLDALDAARARLYEDDEDQGGGEGLLASGRFPHREPARDTRITRLSPPPATPPSPPQVHRLQPGEPGCEDFDLVRSEEGVCGAGKEPSGVGRSSVRSHAKARARGWQRLTGKQHSRVAGVFFGLGAVSGFFAASILSGSDSSARPASSGTSERPDGPLPGDFVPSLGEGRQPDGGVLLQGDTGWEVVELQKRLLQVPNIYEGGEIDGRYDVEVTAAVARFQEWYGIRGDESGVYGDSTHRGLESRTQ